MQEQVIKVLNYFAFFDYSPAFEEVHAYLASKMSKKSLEEVLKSLVKRKRLLEKDKRYTLGEYKKSARQARKERISQAKIRRINPFLRLISLFPQIKLVGLSGSVAMLNAGRQDDIDLFVITAKNRLWTGRFICLVLSSLFGRRKFQDTHTSDKICLNMFFDEAKLAIPQAKRTLYVGHEVLQMKPVVEREEVYRRFLEANDWVFKFFPNAPRSVRNFLTPLEPFANAQVQSRKKLVPSLGEKVEQILKKLQLYIINRHKTTEIITNTQLWFFPDDFEKKLDLGVVDRASFAMGKKQTEGS